MMRILVLDDNDNRLKTYKYHLSGTNVTCVKTAKDCIEKLKDNDYNFVMLDHDLGDEVFVDSNRPDCGMEVVRYLEANLTKTHCIFIHTANDYARNNMVGKLKSAGYNVVDSNFLHIDWANLYSNLKKILEQDIEM